MSNHRREGHIIILLKLKYNLIFYLQIDSNVWLYRRFDLEATWLHEAGFYLSHELRPAGPWKGDIKGGGTWHI